jgi:hypothetical protein
MQTRDIFMFPFFKKKLGHKIIFLFFLLFFNFIKINTKGGSWTLEIT